MRSHYINRSEASDTGNLRGIMRGEGETVIVFMLSFLAPVPASVFSRILNHPFGRVHCVPFQVLGSS
jgi:hypothetical protein